MKNYLLKLSSLFIFFCVCLGSAQNSKIALEGLITDNTELSIPYAAIAIKNKNVGTSSTEEGTFYLTVSTANLADTLEVSSIGFKNFKIKIQDFIDLQNKTIILKENVTNLEDVVILKTTEYAKLALKNLKKTTVKSTHQLKILYRRASVENHKSRFFVEQYIDVVDRGPSSNQRAIYITESRKSADYRFVNKKQQLHPVAIMARINPLREGLSIDNYTWKKTGGTFYDNEDMVILEGTLKKNPKKWLRLYIGIDNYGVYKIETSDRNAIYIYKKNKDGKLYLSYHSREWKGTSKINNNLQARLGLRENKVPVAYRHEAYVLQIETDRKKFKIRNNFIRGKDLGDIEFPYHPEFWKNTSLPPDTKFYKKIKDELKSIYGIPLETQYKLVNKK